MKNNWIVLGGFALVLILPLLNLPPWFAPSEWSKALVFRALALLGIAGVSLALLARKPVLSALKEAVKPHKGLFLLLGGYIGVLLLSTLLSGNVQVGLLGTVLRGGGALDLLLLFLFAVALVNFVSQRGWNLLWSVSIAIGIGVALIALIQQFGSSSDLFVTGVFRPGSTIGGPAFLASYLLLLLFPALVFGLKSYNHGAKAFYLGAVALFIAVIFFGLTRGAYLGLFAGLAWFIAWYPHPYAWRKALQRGLIIITVAGILFIGALNVFQPPQAVQNNTFLSVFYNRIQLESLLEARFGTWVIAWEAVKDKPILGYGIENALVGLNKNFDPHLPGVSNPYEGWWLDRGHNIVLDVLLMGGILALVFFSLFLFFLFKSLRKAKRDNPSQAPFSHAVQALFVAYLVSNLFSLDVFTVQLLFFFAVAWTLWLTRPSPVENLDRLSFPQPLARIVGGVLIPVALLLTWQLSLNPLLANARVNEANYFAEQGDCAQSLSLFEDLLSKEHLSSTQTHIQLSYANAINGCVARDPSLAQFRVKQYQLFKDVAEQRKNHAESWITFGGAATSVGEQALNQNQLEVAQQLFQEAEQAFLTAQALNPKRPNLFDRWATKELVVGNYGSAESKTQECIQLDPNRGSCWWKKGIAEILLNNVPEGESSIQTAKQQGYNIEGPAQLGQLARAYFVVGQYAKAREAALELLERTPENRAQIESFLQSLPN